MVSTEQKGFDQVWDKALLESRVEGKVLIIDRDPDLIQAVREALKRQGQGFSAIVAKDGKSAEKLLRSEPVTLVLYNLKVPKASDIELLKYLSRSYPDVEVIAISGLGGEELQKIVGTKADIECIEKPYAIDGIVEAVKRALERQAEGGVLYHVSTGMFLQLIEMEQRTCTIRLVENSRKKRGALFFRNGILVDARSNGLRGEEAAYEIFSWDRVCLWIQNSCRTDKRKIERDLQAVILEAMRRKDEAAADDNKDQDETPEAEVIIPTEEVVESEVVARVKKRLEKETVYSNDVLDIREDTAWDSLLAQSSRIGAFFDAGELKVAYVDRGDINDYLLVPEEKTIVIAVDPKCPRDKFIKLLTQ